MVTRQPSDARITVFHQVFWECRSCGRRFSRAERYVDHDCAPALPGAKAENHSTRAVLRQVLQEHWLVTIGCDQVAHTDTPVCACSKVALGTHASVGDAVKAWASHVLEVFERAREGA